MKKLMEGPWLDADPSEYDDELISLVQTAYQNAPMGSFIRSSRDVMQSDWKASDVDDDNALDATVFYRPPRAGETWTNFKIQGIGHDGSKEAIKAVLNKLESMILSGEYWIEASDALEHVLYKRDVPFVDDERYAAMVFPNTGLTMSGAQGRYTRKANSQEIHETIFGDPGVKEMLTEEKSKWLSTSDPEFQKVFAAYWLGSKRLPLVKGFPEGLDLENLEINHIADEWIQIVAGGDWQEMIPFSFAVDAKTRKPMIIDLFYSSYQKTPAKEIHNYVDGVKKVSGYMKEIYDSHTTPLPGEKVNLVSTEMAPLDKPGVDILAGSGDYDDDMLPEYDFSGSYRVRKPYGESLHEGAKVGKLKHLTHLEDLIIEDGLEGAQYAQDIIESLSNLLAGETPKRDIRVTTKLDGAPSLVCGINPENGQFFVASKAAFNANPKINYTVEDIARNHGNSTGLQQKLEYALKYMPSVIVDGVYQADLLYVKDDLIAMKDPITGEEMLTFHPNTIVYGVPKQSELGSQVLRSQMGVCIHTKYEGASLGDMRATFTFDDSVLKSSMSVMVVPYRLPNLAGTVTMTAGEQEMIDDIIVQSEELLTHIDPSIFQILLSDEFAPVVYQTYENSKVRSGSIDFDAYELVNHLRNYIAKEVGSKKTPKGQDTARERMRAVSQLADKIDDLQRMIHWQNLIVKAKTLFIGKLNILTSKFSKYLALTSGGIEITGEEGFAVSSVDGGITKIVDRLTFSRANFSPDVKKGWDH